ncbi:uncharacterized protein PHALS_01090 [Plasmopara halstedii]|uniref:Uncharacterized protein n=1 Tax=Plasmopara halstedii TaxID=4781 RepID=A0A0P1ATU9_PLAHL|nr:uncharacterized protein PHALS_01090 [Plasmopara halstedii]CEG44752.1 hypothetical protein PHALS_01090 [Plasmopara halstedii]|eukprot:XP_024581121.1 hypothetical protein PHALS_01090 [Plasmopara halstedii]
METSQIQQENAEIIKSTMNFAKSAPFRDRKTPLNSDINTCVTIDSSQGKRRQMGTSRQEKSRWYD